MVDFIEADVKLDLRGRDNTERLVSLVTFKTRWMFYFVYKTVIDVGIFLNLAVGTISMLTNLNRRLNDGFSYQAIFSRS